MSKEFFQRIINAINPPPVVVPSPLILTAQPLIPTTQLPINTGSSDPLTMQSSDMLGALGTEHDSGPSEHTQAGDQVAPNGDAPTSNPIKEAEQVADAEGSEQDVEEYCQKCVQCEIVTVEMLKKVFSNASTAELKTAANELNYSISLGNLDSHERISHFLGQCRHEGGKKILVSENLDYAESALKLLFSYYKKNPAEAKKHGRNSKHAADQEAIANHAYSNRIGNGDATTGDGWKFRGRGIKQLTGRGNYRAFTKSHKALWGEDINFEENPDLLSTEGKYAVRSAISFWIDNSLYSLADAGVTESASKKISAKINPGEKPPNSNRYSFSKEIFTSREFENICFNKSNKNSNQEAKNPK
jgi:putative chitinase